MRDHPTENPTSGGARIAAARLRELLADRTLFRKAPTTWLQATFDRLLSASLAQCGITAISEWGIGYRSRLASPDLAALDYLKHYADKISDCICAPVSIQILFTDTHARVNGVDAESLRQYADQITRAATQRKMSCRMMSGIIRDVTSKGYAELLCEWEAAEDTWQRLSAFTRAELIRRAARCARGSQPDLAAKEYARTAGLEAVVLSRFVTDGIFLTYQTPNMAFLLPRVPLLFIFVGPGRLTRRPWFADHVEASEIGDD